MFESKIGIVGLGFVGKAVYDAYSNSMTNIYVYDINPALSNSTLTKVMECDAIFVCVPSPAKENGDCDTSILNSVLYLLKDYKNVIISKTTAPPDFYEKMQKVYPNLVHVPEFLTAAKASSDYHQEKRTIIGGSIPAYRHEAERIIKIAQKIEQVYHCSIGEASLIKYISNSFLATKVVFMNEMYQLAQVHNYNWRNISQILASDLRIGSSHLQVPGPDEQFGFGGACFPKDTNALVRHATKFGVQLSTLKAAMKKNLLLRLQKPK